MSKKENKSLKRVPPEAEIIGRNLRDLRLERNLSRREVAGLLDVSFQQVQKYETGQNRFPLDRLYKLKHYFDVSYERFFEGVDPNNSGYETSLSAKDKDVYAVYMELVRLNNTALKKKICQVVHILVS